jgi:phosphatidylglycerophosphate synthase
LNRPTTAEVRATFKARDSWWTVLLVDPIAGPLLRVVSPYRWVTPNRLTGLAFLFGLAAAACFWHAGAAWLVAGALLYHAGFIIDCLDGKLARLRGNGTIFGEWLDFIGDRVRVTLCAVVLLAGQYRVTGRAGYLLLATFVVFVALFRYVNSAEIKSVEADIRHRLTEAGVRPAVDPARAADSEPAGMGELRDRLTMVMGARDWLVRHRIRGHLVSAIEFEMATLVIAPIAATFASDALIWVPVVTGTAMLLMEAVLVYRLFLAARAADRSLRRATTPAADLRTRGREADGTGTGTGGEVSGRVA